MILIGRFNKYQNTPVFITLFLVLIINVKSLAQNDLTISDFVFTTNLPTNTIKDLEHGTRAFKLQLEQYKSQYQIVNAKRRKSLKSVLDSIHMFLRTNKDEIITLLVRGKFDKKQLEDYIDLECTGNICFQQEQQEAIIEKLKLEGKHIIVVFEQDITETSINQIRSERKFSKWFSKDPINKLVEFKSFATSKSELYDEVLLFWKSTGKSPNFLEANQVETEVVKQVVDSLNKLRRFRGIVEFNGELLNEVRWKNAPQTITTAKFSFPLTSKEQILSPYKNGYRITPSEVIHHKGQSDSPRLFTAYNVAIQDELIYDFAFDNNVVNQQEPDWDRVITKDISFIEDSERGDVLYLGQQDSFIDYFKSNTLNFETPISISVWLKPDRIPQFMGLIGFGTAFSVKLRRGSPDFTMATIKDHVVEFPLKKGIWQHLVVIYNPQASIDFYVDGEKIGEIQTSEINPSNQSLVIGNNIWGEQYYGAMDDLKVWNRGLAPAEVTQLYEAKTDSKTVSWYVIMGVLFGGAILAMVLLLRKKPEKIISSEAIKPQDKDYITHELKRKENKNTLSLFGGFQLILSNEKTVSFSPLQKQLISFLILSKLDENRGVTSSKLTETFWPGVSKNKAKENRSGNMRKLRKVLSEIDGLEVVFEEKRWIVSHTNMLVVDVYEYIQLKSRLEAGMAGGRIALNELEDFLEIIKKGNVLPSIQTEWVDYFKAKISNDIEQLLAAIYKEQHANIPKGICVKIAKTILLFDSLNENALQILINEWVAMGKHGLAKDAYTSFSKNYELLYGEMYSVDFQDLIIV
ncbi:LamG domain-containing protein [Aestuariibaculum sediminum]|uniref:LamG-like jellyroll fold domain-containing protein n=1 Tax=Aestuariibaculum sediminum TaxID=2770637 RepID=A0A8J6Q2L1_9FLAO|nr:LamG-like jellyroll fold domain-containing protein [Aestuariibaculum sediminum]MBD0832286.1 hypothetical protein [Aestuariibaculum sediminum]